VSDILFDTSSASAMFKLEPKSMLKPTVFAFSGGADSATKTAS